MALRGLISILSNICFKVTHIRSCLAKIETTNSINKEESIYLQKNYAFDDAFNPRNLWRSQNPLNNVQNCQGIPDFFR